MRRERWMVWGSWPLCLSLIACQEANPDFDGPAEAGGETTSSSSTGAGPASGSSSSGPVATGDVSSGGSSGEPPGTSSGEPPGTSSGEPGGSTTGCEGMICEDVCIDPMTDPDHCGMCDNNCVGQQECIEGMCLVP